MIRKLDKSYRQPSCPGFKRLSFIIGTTRDDA